MLTMAVMSASATFIRSGPASISALVSSRRRYRSGQASHADARSRNQVALRDRLQCLRSGGAQIGLRIRQMRDGRGIGFLARFAARLHEFTVRLLF